MKAFAFKCAVATLVGTTLLAYGLADHAAAAPPAKGSATAPPSASAKAVSDPSLERAIAATAHLYQGTNDLTRARAGSVALQADMTRLREARRLLVEKLSKSAVASERASLSAQIGAVDARSRDDQGRLRAMAPNIAQAEGRVKLSQAEAAAARAKALERLKEITLGKDRKTPLENQQLAEALKEAKAKMDNAMSAAAYALALGIASSTIGSGPQPFVNAADAGADGSK